MSEQNKDHETQPLQTQPLKTQPLRKTSAVPLRKETVRVTLKSAPAGVSQDKDPTAPTPPAPSAMSAPRPSAPNLPDVTSAVPLKQETMRVTLKADTAEDTKPAPPAPAAAPPAPAPTIPLGQAPGAPKPPAPAPTIPLNVGAAATGPATVPLKTQPLQKAGSSQPLPKATVQLQQTQQLSPVTPVGRGAATIQTVVDEESSAARGGNTAQILAVVAFLFSLFVLYAQFQHAGVWVKAHKDGSYGAVFEAPAD